MTEMRWAFPDEKNEIIDFCDFVFSKYHRPHDFETLLPKLYGDRENTSVHHFIIREDGHIVAALLAYPVEMHIGSHSFTTIGIGSVSVHPRAQGRGYMKHLLAAADDHARETDAVFAFLGGQRQRYGYFGYQPMGYHMKLHLSPANVRHSLKAADDGNIDIIPMAPSHVPTALRLHDLQIVHCSRTAENFMDAVRSWYCEPHAIYINGEMTGYAVVKSNGSEADISELVIASETALPSVLKKLVSRFGPLNITVAPFMGDRARYLTGICESWHIARDHMFKIYHEDRLRAALKNAGLPHLSPLFFEGFELPLPLFVCGPDSV